MRSFIMGEDGPRPPAGSPYKNEPLTHLNLARWPSTETLRPPSADQRQAEGAFTRRPSFSRSLVLTLDASCFPPTSSPLINQLAFDQTMAVPHSFLTRGLSFTHEEPSSVLSTPSSPSSASEDSRESSPAFDSPKADAAFEHVEGERRTTTQGKDWRAPANMHKKTFWEVSASDLWRGFRLNATSS